MEHTFNTKKQKKKTRVTVQKSEQIEPLKLLCKQARQHIRMDKVQHIGLGESQTENKERRI